MGASDYATILKKMISQVIWWFFGGLMLILQFA
jgi:hypothetical protein